MANGSAAEPDVGGGLSIREVSRLLTVPAPTIRSWERRYGVPQPPRSAGGHRRYSPAEVLTLRRMRDEIARGRRAAEAAMIVSAAGSPGEPQHSLMTSFLAATERLDRAGVRAALDQASERLGLDAAITGVLFPGMHQVGAWWQTGRCDLAHEQMATLAARAWLHEALAQSPPPWRRQTILLASGPRDLHTLGQEAMRVVLARRGWGCRLLGARTPAPALVTAIRATGPAGVVVVSHLSVGRRAAVEALRAAEPTGTRLFYAGNAFLAPPARAGVPGSYLGEDLVGAADIIDAALPAAPSGVAQVTGSPHAALS